MLLSGSHKSAFAWPESISGRDSALWESYTCPAGSAVIFTAAIPPAIAEAGLPVTIHLLTRPSRPFPGQARALRAHRRMRLDSVLGRGAQQVFAPRWLDCDRHTGRRRRAVAEPRFDASARVGICRSGPCQPAAPAPLQRLRGSVYQQRLSAQPSRQTRSGIPAAQVASGRRVRPFERSRGTATAPAAPAASCNSRRDRRPSARWSPRHRASTAASRCPRASCATAQVRPSMDRPHGPPPAFRWPRRPVPKPRPAARRIARTRPAPTR